MNEQRNITIEVFRDKEGHPTCSKNLETGEFCRFLRTSHMGCREHCGYATRNDTLERRNAGEGTLIPHKDCPVWKDEV